MIKPKKHSEYWQKDEKNRNCPLCGRFMKSIKLDLIDGNNIYPEKGDVAGYNCEQCDIQVLW